MVALEKERIIKVALVVFAKNEKGNDFWEKVGFSDRNDLVCRKKAFVVLVRHDIVYAQEIRRTFMLTLYFSGTGNTEYIAGLFSREMGVKCLSIEAAVNFTAEIKAHDTIAFCYPIYGSRVPRVMRKFVAKYMSDLIGKKLIIFVTQLMFSGDGARVFSDMFWEDSVEVVYAEHFNMPNNVCNAPMLKHASSRRIQKYMKKAETKIVCVCKNIRKGIVKKRGFSRFSQWLGNIQGKRWQGDSKNPSPQQSIEERAKSGIIIHSQCNACGVCVKICPMKNLASHEGRIQQRNDCTVCYRCVNMCPQKAITVLFHRRPKWQYKGIDTVKQEAR